MIYKNLFWLFTLILNVGIVLNIQAQIQTQTFISSDNFTVPEGVTSVTIFCWGAGGGGGTGGEFLGTNYSGGGGGGGGFSGGTLTVNQGDIITITVGTGGSGATSASFTAGGSGGNSVVQHSSGTLTASGGDGGVGGFTTALGGVGSFSGTVSNPVSFNGGTGAGRSAGGTNLTGGGGGGGAGDSENGNTGTSGSSGGQGGIGGSNNGGDGGNGGNNESPAGNASDYGGGGGGSGSSPGLSGGNGANGFVIIQWGMLLPVELANFSTNLFNEEAVVLKWTTYSEHNNKGFEIQRSNNGFNWEFVNFVNGQGFTFEQMDYKYIDAIKAGHQNLYYRLKQIDFDGAFEYSHVVNISAVANFILPHKVYPNPSSNILYVISEAGKSIIYNATGQPLKMIELFKGTNRIDIEDLPKGNYVLQIIENNGKRSVNSFIVNP